MKRYLYFLIPVVLCACSKNSVRQSVQITELTEPNNASVSVQNSEAEDEVKTVHEEKLSQIDIVSEEEYLASYADTDCSLTKPKMVFVEGGTFYMHDWRNQKYHEVTVSDFMICSVEMGIMYNWWESVAECNKMSREQGYTPCYSLNGITDEREWGTPPSGSDFDTLKIWAEIKCDFNADGYRLPTTAEWEWAAKGGNKSKGYKYSGSNNLDEVGWFKENKELANRDLSQNIALKKSNELGLYDMSGNLWEWVWDWYWNYSELPQINPTGYSDSKCSLGCKTTRGGCLENEEKYCEITSSEWAETIMESGGYFSFRPCRSLKKDFSDIRLLELNDINLKALKPVMIVVPCELADPSLNLKPYEIAESEMNRELYALISETELCQPEGNLPVEGLSWYDSVILCNKLSLVYGYTPCYSIFGEKDPSKWNSDSLNFEDVECDFNADGYRLPTENEWQYAAVSGDLQKTGLYNGKDKNNIRRNCWYADNSDGICHSVFSTDTNWIKLYGMCGNVAEWCLDSYDTQRKVLCGGSYFNKAEECTIYSRDGLKPDTRGNPTGIRLCRSIGER